MRGKTVQCLVPTLPGSQEENCKRDATCQEHGSYDEQAPDFKVESYRCRADRVRHIRCAILQMNNDLPLSQTVPAMPNECSAKHESAGDTEDRFKDCLCARDCKAHGRVRHLTFAMSGGRRA
jgi:hypothetical protein